MSSLTLEEICQIWKNNPGDVIRMISAWTAKPISVCCTDSDHLFVTEET